MRARRAHTREPGALSGGERDPLGPCSICTFNPETVSLGSLDKNKMSSVCREAQAAPSPGGR
jgi:hypothetical protein